ncbi:MAG TPA: hypothetical protein DCP92_22545 [Nitrospiraceae bacterium]|jgi:hypothetical protein|nr:hypothetical protein [Nitrospiraceae bacterium]
MWKLYKQEQVSDSQLDLIMASESLDSLKSEASRLAILTLSGTSLINGEYKDLIWVHNVELKNYELSVNHKYKFIIQER